MPPIPLDTLVGPEHAATFLDQRARDIARMDCIDLDTALRWVRERVSGGDPLILAAPGQTWFLCPDVDQARAPGRSLVITDRFALPPRVHAVCDDGKEDELLIDVLEMYQLKKWTWIG